MDNKSKWLARGRAEAFRWLAEELAACYLLREFAELLRSLADFEDEAAGEEAEKNNKQPALPTTQGGEADIGTGGAGNGLL